MLVEVNGLNIMLVIEFVVEFMMSLKSFTVVLLMITAVFILIVVISGLVATLMLMRVVMVFVLIGLMVM